MSFFVLPIQIEPNTGFGQGALATGQGARNVALGNSALAQITNTGEDNIGIGYRSGRFLTTQDGNVLVGSSTMENATGTTNIALGLNALRGVVSVNQSSNNVAIGNDSLFQAQGTNQSTAVGSSALRTNTGDSNTALGYGAGYSNFRGTGNTFIGANSGFFFQSNAVLGEVTGNTFIGESSGISITGGKKNTIIGRYSGNQGGLDIRTLSNYIVISDGDGNPRIWVNNTGQVNFPGGSVLPGGTANGVLYLNGSKVVTSESGLTFDGANLGIGVTPSAWSGLSGGAFQNLGGGAVWSRGADEVWFSQNAYENSGRKYIASLAASAYQQLSGQHRWYIAPSGTAGNAISFTQAMTLDASGNLGIGETNPGNKLVVNGGITAINAATVGASQTRPLLSFENPISRLYMGDGTGYSFIFSRRVSSTTTNLLEIADAGNVVMGSAALATNATNGFLYVPGCAGTPTGTPTGYGGRVPIVVDTTNNKLYFYSGGAWRDAGP